MRTSRGQRLVAVRPTLAEFVLEMPRGAQVIYPKDLGPILVSADIFPGARVLESGIGSGALTIALLRAVGPLGQVVGYELRDDFAAKAQENVAAFLGPDLPLTVEVRDVYDGIEVTDLDRIMLDLPEPWRVVKHAATALSPGGILLVVPAHDRPGRAPARGARRVTVRHARDLRGAAPRLARRGSVGAPRPPHGGAHRIHHARPAARAVDT